MTCIINMLMCRNAMFSSLLLQLATGSRINAPAALLTAAISLGRVFPRPPVPNPMPGLITMGNPMVDHMVPASPADVAAAGLVFGGECPERYRSDPAGARQVLNDFKQKAQAAGTLNVVAGGAALNTARVAGWWLQTQGVDGVYIGSIGGVGDDADAGFLRAACAANHVVPLFQTVTDTTLPAGCATGCSLVLTCETTSERSILGVPGAARGLRAAGVEEAAAAALRSRATYLYATSFTLTTPERVAAVEKARAVLAEGEGRRCLAVNLSSAGLQARECVKSTLDALAPSVDILFGNHGEAVAFCEARGLPTGETLLPSLARCFPRAAVVITCSASPTLTFTRDGGAAEYPVPSLAAPVVDANGAGDAFVGGVLASLLRGLPLAEGVRAGHACAAVVLAQHGCRLPPA